MNETATPDVVINKVQSIQRCVQRARQEHKEAGEAFASDYTRQDAAILNIIRACEQAIDLASYVIKDRRMGIPTSSAESFSLLAVGKVIGSDLSQRMVGFRNIAVHQYQNLDLEIVEAIIASGLDDLLGFSNAVLAYLRSPTP